MALVEFQNVTRIYKTGDHELKALDGDWQSSNGISYEGKTITMDIYSVEHNKVRFLTEQNEITELSHDGVYLCLRLKDTAAIVLGIVVLYNLGVMSYVERHRELATLKVLGFRDKAIGTLLITQNIWLTVIGSLIGIPGGVGVLYVLVKALVSEYELSIIVSLMTYVIGIALTLGVSLLVGLMVARKNKKIDMVEALKGAE